MSNTIAKVGDGVALKRTNDKRSKWRYGKVSAVREKGHGEEIQVEWQKAKKKGRKRQEWIAVSVFNPRVLLIPPAEELSETVRQWCAEEGLYAVRKIWKRESGYLFVGEKEPHNEVCFVEETTEAAALEYWPDRKDSEDPEAIWDNDSFGQTDSSVMLMDGDRPLESPEDCHPQFRI